MKNILKIKYMFALINLFGFTNYALAECPKDLVIPNEYLVTTKSDASIFSFNKTKSHVKVLKNISGVSSDISVLSKTNNEAKTFLVNASNLQDVSHAYPNSDIQKNCLVEPTATIDPMFNQQKWYFNSLGFYPYSIKAPLRSVVVAISDTGVDVHHPDLRTNIWYNSAEKNGRSGVDDDGNGYIDDIFGYDFADNDSDPIPKTSDTMAAPDHGTHVAGIVAAETGNGLGVSGVSGNSIRLMVLKGFKSNGPGSLADLLETIYYATNNGAQIINASWGADKVPGAAEINAVRYATNRGVVFVAAAGNNTMPTSSFSPAAVSKAVTVGSINSKSQLSTFSNYGKEIDLVAPGGDGWERGREEYIFNTALNNRYVGLYGTSMAAPVVSGAIALLMAQHPSINAFKALDIIKRNASTANLESYDRRDKRLYYRVNIKKALEGLKSLQGNNNSNSSSDDLSSLDTDEVANNDSADGTGCSKKDPEGTSEEKQGALPIFYILLLLPFIVAIKKKWSLS